MYWSANCRQITLTIQSSRVRSYHWKKVNVERWPTDINFGLQLQANQIPLDDKGSPQPCNNAPLVTKLKTAMQGSCVSNAAERWLIPLSTLNQHSIDTWLTLDQPLSWKSFESQLFSHQCIRVSWHSVDYSLTVVLVSPDWRPSIDRDVNQGYWSTLNAHLLNMISM